MFLSHEGEALREAIENLKEEAADRLAAANEVERAWKAGDRAWLRRQGYLPPFQCSACGAKGEEAIASTGESDEGEPFAICRCGHEAI